MQRFFVIVCALVFLKDCPAYFWGVCGNKGERMCLWTLESSVPLVTCILTFLNCLSRGVGSAGVLYCSWRGQKGAGQNNEKAYSGTPFQFTFLTLQRKKKEFLCAKHHASTESQCQTHLCNLNFAFQNNGPTNITSKVHVFTGQT